MSQVTAEGVGARKGQSTIAGLRQVLCPRDNARDGQVTRGHIEHGIVGDCDATVDAEVDRASRTEGGATQGEGVGGERGGDVAKIISGGDIHAALVEGRLPGVGIGARQGQRAVRALGEATRATEFSRNGAGLQGEGATSQGGRTADGAGLHGHGADGFVIRDIERTTVHREGGGIGEDASGTEGQGTGVQVGGTREGVRTRKDEFARTGLGQAKGTRAVRQD